MTPVGPQKTLIIILRCRKSGTGVGGARMLGNSHAFCGFGLLNGNQVSFKQHIFDFKGHSMIHSAKNAKVKKITQR
jgi:hypothetical protein